MTQVTQQLTSVELLQRNNRVSESLSNLFEDSSPKVFLWQVIRFFDILSLTTDSRYLQSEPLKYLFKNVFHPDKVQNEETFVELESCRSLSIPGNMKKVSEKDFE